MNTRDGSPVVLENGATLAASVLPSGGDAEMDDGTYGLYTKSPTSRFI